MRTTCHYFLFPDVKGYHFVFKKPELISSEATGAPENPKTLAETLLEARKMLEKAKEKIKLVNDYYKGKKMPNELVKALNVFNKSTKELEQAVKRYGDVKGKGSGEKQVKMEQEIIEKIMNGMDEIFVTFREKNDEATKNTQRKTAGDPMYASLDYGPKIGDTTLRPPPVSNRNYIPQAEDASGKKSQAKAAPDEATPKPKTVVEKVVAKNSPEYWDIIVHSVVRKILQKMDTGVDPDPLTPEEKQAIRFFANPGKSRNYDYRDGVKITRFALERDITGKYLRIRGYKASTSSQAQDSSIMAFQTSAKARWFNETPQYTPEEKIEHNKGDLGKKLDWLSSTKVPYGSSINIEQTISTENLGNSGQLVKKFQMTIVKESGGAYRVETYVQEIETNKKGSGKPLVQGRQKQDEMIRTFGTPVDARVFVEGFLKDNASLVAMEATPSDKAREEKLAEEKRLQKLEKLSGMLMRYAIPGVDDDGPRKKRASYINAMRDICDFVVLNKISKWESKEDFLYFHVKVENGFVNLLERNMPIDGENSEGSYRVADRATLPRIDGDTKIA